MSLPERHELPDGTPVYSGAVNPSDESGVDLMLRARPPGHTIVSRSKRLNEGGASFGGR